MIEHIKTTFEAGAFVAELADSLPQIVCVFELESGDGVYVNRRYKEYFGDIGASLRERINCVHEEDALLIQELRANLFERSREVECRLRRFDGAFRWHRLVYQILDKAGLKKCVLGTALDIDDIFNARDKITDTTALLRLAQDAAGAASWDWDLRSGKLRLSAEAAFLYNLPKTADPTGIITADYEEIANCVLPEDLDRIKGIRADAMKTLSDFQLEFRAKSRDARCVRWLYAYGRFICEADTGKATKIVGLTLDITARKAVEDALRISEERLDLFLDGESEGLWDWNISTNEVWISERWKSIIGITDDQSAISRAFWVDHVHPDDRLQVTDAVQAYFEGKTDTLECEHRLLRRDHSEFWVLTRGRVVERKESGEASRVIGTQINISRRKAAEMRLQHMATHDVLTGLPNRVLFRDRLEQAAAENRLDKAVYAVLACDLDRFKSVNDSFGHAAGDKLLRVVADRMTSVLRPWDTVARVGGDEFAVILTRLATTALATDLAERLIAAVAQPIELDGKLVNVGLSVGIIFSGTSTGDPHELFEQADIALYEAKSGGRGTVSEFKSEAHTRVSTRGQLGLDMKEAIRRGDFCLHYQPVVDVETNAVTSFEALMRWHHPVYGDIAPSEFIPLAEETGLILPLGSWALNEACREAVRWPESVRVAVNVSAIQLRRDGFEATVLTALAGAGLQASRLKLEVTESVLMRDADGVITRLHRLRALGVRIALDDFGTGFSSLSYLRRFTFDKIKIDRAFVQEIADPDTAAIIRAVVSIGERLGVGVVAEGVETTEQLELVKREGCTEVQGFLFGRPMLPSEALHLVDRTKPTDALMHQSRGLQGWPATDAA